MLWRLLRDFFKGSALPKFYTSSYIILIPKVLELDSFDKFRPISLYSVACNFFSKILAKRMTHLLPHIVSPKQGAFIPGSSSFEKITLSQEMVHSLNRIITGSNVMVKIDMAKAYDKVD